MLVVYHDELSEKAAFSRLSFGEPKIVVCIVHAVAARVEPAATVTVGEPTVALPESSKKFTVPETLGGLP